MLWRNVRWKSYSEHPTKGYGEAIVLPEINADHFEIKTNLLQLVQANPFYGRESENPHAHINSFKRITSTLRFRNVPNDVIKLMMFPYSLEGAAKTWYEKEPPNSILTWEDLVTKFVNQFFPPSKTTHLKNEISRFTQKFEETFSEAWERFKELLRACPHHGLTESNASRMNATSSQTDERIDKLADQLSTLVEIVSKKDITPAPVKAVEESCVTCGGAHSWYNCPATDNNQATVCATTGSGTRNRGTTDKEQTNFQGSTAQIPPPVIPISISEPDVPKALPKTTLILKSDIPKKLPNNNLIPLPEHKSPNLDHQDNPSTPQPPPEPPDVEIRFELDTAVMNNFDVLNKDACFNLEEGEIDVLANIEDDDSFTFVI
ncbi:reverse transcriptase domain-containing protein [Tanacetum coccineum]